MHRHQFSGRKLGRKTAPRKALMRNLASQIILHESITTTLPKAKEVRPILEKLITRAKKDTVTNRRLVAKYLSNNDKSVAKLFEQIGPLYTTRNGGYLRIIKTLNRKGDNAPMAIIQLLDTDKLATPELKVKSKKLKAETKDPKPADKENKPSTTKAQSTAKKVAVTPAKKAAKAPTATKKVGKK